RIVVRPATYRQNGNPPPLPRRRRLPKPPARAAALPRRTYKDIIHDAEREKYPFDYAVRNGGVFRDDLAPLQRLIDQLQVPFVSSYISTLGGANRASLLFTISLDPRQNWNNGILENSRYAKFDLRFEKDKWVLEQITRNKVEK